MQPLLSCYVFMNPIILSTFNFPESSIDIVYFDICRQFASQIRDKLVVAVQTTQIKLGTGTSQPPNIIKIK